MVGRQVLDLLIGVRVPFPEPNYALASAIVFCYACVVLSQNFYAEITFFNNHQGTARKGLAYYAGCAELPGVGHRV